MILEGPMITFVAGFLVYLNYFEVEDIIILSILANTLGDILHYLAGRWGRGKLVLKYGHYVGITPERVIKLEKHFEKHGGKTLLFGKVTLAFGSLTLVSAGVARYPFWKFLLFNSLGEIPKTLLFFALGYYFGTAYKNFSHYLFLSTLAIVLITIVIFMLYRMSSQVLQEIDEE